MLLQVQEGFKLLEVEVTRPKSQAQAVLKSELEVMSH